MITEESNPAEELETTPTPEETPTEAIVESAAPAEVVFPVVEEKAVEFPVLDLSKATKESILAFYEQLKAILQASASSANFKKVDELTKEVKTAWEAIKQGERAEAIAAFKAGNEDSEEGFSFKGVASCRTLISVDWMRSRRLCQGKKGSLFVVNQFCRKG